jgi:DNA repair exonuclease SbcCD nuclease subunit
VSDLGDEIDCEARIAELERTAQDLQRKLAAARAKSADLVEAFYAGAREGSIIAGRPSAPPRPKPDKRKGTPETAFLILSDVHVGAVTETYSTEVAAQRVRQAVQKTAKLAAIQRSDHPVRECVLVLMGDLIENTTIFPHQSWAVDASTFEQVFAAARMIEEAVLGLLAEFDAVTVYEVPGNHGRVGRGKGRQSLDYEGETNWDRIVGRVAQDRLEGRDRLTWHAAESWYRMVPIGRYVALCHHGDTIRQFGGNTPAGGIGRKHQAWASGVLAPFTDAYLGHFHTPMTIPLANGSRVFVSPAVVSDSEFGKEFIAASSPPGVRLHFVDGEKGRVTAEYLIQLD